MIKLIILVCFVAVVSANKVPSVGSSVGSPVPAAPVKHVVRPTLRPLTIPQLPSLPPLRPLVIPPLPALPPIPPLPTIPTVPPFPVIPPMIPQFIYVMTDGISKFGQSLTRPGGLFPLNTSSGEKPVAAKTSRRRRRYINN